jgi:tetratricopeptide (TPR) repeat protein
VQRRSGVPAAPPVETPVDDASPAAKAATGATAAVVAEPVEESGPRSFDDHDEHFFDRAAAVHAAAVASLEDHHELDPIDEHRLARRVGRRRALARYVVGVFAVASLVCGIAFTRELGRLDASRASPRADIVAPVVTSALVLATPPAPSASPSAGPSPTPASSVGAAPGASADSVVAAPASSVGAAPSALADAVAAAPSATPPPRSARAAREAARRALEAGDRAQAVAVARQAVELDPSDAEAWLVLGAALMESGRGAEARSTFGTCAKLATHGPVGECRAMLQP